MQPIPGDINKFQMLRCQERVFCGVGIHWLAASCQSLSPASSDPHQPHIFCLLIFAFAQWASIWYQYMQVRCENTRAKLHCLPLSLGPGDFRRSLAAMFGVLVLRRALGRAVRWFGGAGEGVGSVQAVLNTVSVDRADDI